MVHVDLASGVYRLRDAAAAAAPPAARLLLFSVVRLQRLVRRRLADRAETVAAVESSSLVQVAGSTAPAGLLQEVPASPEKRKVGFAAQASPSKRASVADWLFGKSWAAAATTATATVAAAPPPPPVEEAVEVVMVAPLAAVPKRKVGFDAEVPPAKAAAGATPGLPFCSTAAGLAAVRAAVKAEKAARGMLAEEEERTDGELNWRQRANLASQLAAQKNRVGGKKATRGGPT